jgi:hypothetical protein
VASKLKCPCLIDNISLVVTLQLKLLGTVRSRSNLYPTAEAATGSVRSRSNLYPTAEAATGSVRSRSNLYPTAEAARDGATAIRATTHSYYKTF